MTFGQNNRVCVRLPSATLLELLWLSCRPEGGNNKGGGNKRKNWVDIRKDEIGDGETLRTAAQR